MRICPQVYVRMNDSDLCALVLALIGLWTRATRGTDLISGGRIAPGSLGAERLRCLARRGEDIPRRFLVNKCVSSYKLVSKEVSVDDAEELHSAAVRLGRPVRHTQIRCV